MRLKRLTMILLTSHQSSSLRWCHNNRSISNTCLWTCLRWAEVFIPTWTLQFINQAITLSSNTLSMDRSSLNRCGTMVKPCLDKTCGILHTMTLITNNSMVRYKSLTTGRMSSLSQQSGKNHKSSIPPSPIRNDPVTIVLWALAVMEVARYLFMKVMMASVNQASKICSGQCTHRTMWLVYPRVVIPISCILGRT